MTFDPHFARLNYLNIGNFLLIAKNPNNAEKSNHEAPGKGTVVAASETGTPTATLIQQHRH